MRHLQVLECHRRGCSKAKFSKLQTSEGDLYSYAPSSGFHLLRALFSLKLRNWWKNKLATLFIDSQYLATR